VDKKLELLARVPLFSRMDGTALSHVAKLADEVDLPAGKELLHEGAIAYEFFLILEGSVRIERDGAPLNRLGPGDFLGEIALLDGGRRTATAIADSTVRLLVLGRREFNSLLNEFPDVRAAVLEALAGRVREHESVDD